MKQKKKNLNYRKVSSKLEKVGGLRKATYAQVEHIYKMLMLKYVMSLEDQLKEDKAHLLLKERTIQDLTEDIRHKNNLLRRWQVNGNKNARRANKVYEEYRAANKGLCKQNQDLVKDNYELTRAYNGLSDMGRFAEELGVDIKKYNGQLPENNKWDFEHKHTLTETGEVKHKFRMKPKKKVPND